MARDRSSSAPSSDPLHEVARSKLSQGRLTRDPPLQINKVRGAGAKCSLCDRPIRDADLQLEFRPVNGVRRFAWFHSECHQIWDSERSRAVEGNSGT